jgi:hypothetical protein
MVKSVQP